MRWGGSGGQGARGWGVGVTTSNSTRRGGKATPLFAHQCFCRFLLHLPHHRMLRSFACACALLLLGGAKVRSLISSPPPSRRDDLSPHQKPIRLSLSLALPPPLPLPPPSPPPPHPLALPPLAPSPVSGPFSLSPSRLYMRLPHSRLYMRRCRACRVRVWVGMRIHSSSTFSIGRCYAY
jgi:hypothetical protein